MMVLPGVAQRGLAAGIGGQAALPPVHVAQIDCKLRTHNILGRDQDVEVAVGGDLVGAHLAKAHKGARIAPVHTLHDPAHARQGQRHALRTMVPGVSATSSSPAAGEIMVWGVMRFLLTTLRAQTKPSHLGACWWGL